MKFDLRACTYEGSVMRLAARFYQGQTINFLTAGGGRAPVCSRSKVSGFGASPSLGTCEPDLSHCIPAGGRRRPSVGLKWG